MTLPQTDPNEAIDRLTPKERECLSRWLHHATAKEIALDLGISHHAVEKRLKSARQKLGVATSLDAARLLAEAEGYGRTVCQPSEVAATRWEDQDEQVAGTAKLQSLLPRRRPWIIGVTIMSLTLLAILALTPFNMQSTAPQSQEVRVIDKRSGSPADVEAIADETFARLDENKSGFIEGSELTNVSISTVRVSRTPGVPIAMSNASLADADTDKDGRVSRVEYRQRFTAMTNAARK